jgi:hypothetical protein
LQTAAASAIVRDEMFARARALVTPALSLMLVALALAGFVLSGASIPHSHAPGHPGLYNQEHDLSYLATFGAGAPVPATPSAAPLVLLVVLAVALAAETPRALCRRHADFRAPPLR